MQSKETKSRNTHCGFFSGEKGLNHLFLGPGKDKRPHPKWGCLLPKPPMCFSVWEALLMPELLVLGKDSWTISSPSSWVFLPVPVATPSCSSYYWAVWWYQLQVCHNPTSCHGITVVQSRRDILGRENWSSEKDSDLFKGTQWAQTRVSIASFIPLLFSPSSCFPMKRIYIYRALLGLG